MPRYLIKFRDVGTTTTVTASHVAIQGLGALIVFSNGHTSTAQVVAVFPTESIAGVTADPESLGG